MISRNHSLMARIGQLVRYLSLVLLPALTSEADQRGLQHRGHTVSPSPSQQMPPTAQVPARSLSYLAVVGAPPLRINPTPTPPVYDLDPLPPGLDVPMPSNEHSATTISDSRSPALPLAPRGTPQDKPNQPTEADEPPPILPDDLRREVRPEDVVPFFQYPRGRIPAPGQPATPQLPPSSATYQQQ